MNKNKEILVDLTLKNLDLAIYDLIDESELQEAIYLGLEQRNDFIVLKDKNQDSLLINITKVKSDSTTINVKCTVSYENDSNENKKNKYVKYNYNDKRAKSLIKQLGITKAQQIHAEDKVICKFVKLSEFLKLNRAPFKQISLYQKTDDYNYEPMRFKNLFSSYPDEISDFEKISFLVREENQKLFIYFDLDEDVLKYDSTSASLLDRKFTRELAKAIYNAELGFTDKQLIDILRVKDIFVQIEEVISADNKQVWSKIVTKDMNLKQLSNEYESSNREKKAKRTKFYHSKRELRRKERHSFKFDSYE